MNYLWNAVSSGSNGFDLLLFLLASAMKATFLLGFVGVLCLVLRRLSAATRHLLWTLALCAALLLPFLSVLEVWEVPVLPAQISSWSAAQPQKSSNATDDALLLPSKGKQGSISVSTELNESETKASDFQPALNPFEELLPRMNSSDVYPPPQQQSATLWSQSINWAVAVWLAGALLLLCRLLVGFTATNLLTRGATEFKDPKLNGLFASLLSELQLQGRVRLLRSERTLMPIVCGVLRPVVLLPASADEWPEERSRMVLLHELTHVTRRDCLTQMLAQAACAFYWFNPIVWHAARRLRVEREQACDDYVLSIGTKPSDYAHHLLEIARFLQERSVFQWSHTTTVAMARHSQLEGRLLAILSKEGTRRSMPQVLTACLAALMFALFMLLAIVRPTVGNAQSSQVSETAFDGETNAAAAKSPFGIFSTSVSTFKGKAMIQGAQPPGTFEPQGNNAHALDNLQEKTLEGAQVIQDVRPDAQVDPVSEIESVESAPPHPDNPPAPPPMPEPGITVMPFIKAKYQEERKAEAQGQAADFMDEMAAVGYSNLSVDELINLKATGVTASYVRSLRGLGLGNLTPREISGLSVNGVTPAFIEGIRNAGYRELTAKELLSFRLHGVTADFINKLRNAGYNNLSAKQLTEFAVHGVTLEFINSMRAAGFGNLSAKELVTLRVHGINAEYARAARKRLGDLTIKQIVALKIEGLME